MMTNEGSTISCIDYYFKIIVLFYLAQIHSNQNHQNPSTSSNRTYFFQVSYLCNQLLILLKYNKVPVMLTPAELLNGISQNPLPNARPETNNIDIHIHTFLHSNPNNPAEAQNLNSNMNNINNNNVSSNQSICFL